MKQAPAPVGTLLAAIAFAVLAGCASPPPSGTASRPGQSTGQPDAALQERQDRLLAQPLSQEAAAELALLHPALTPQFAALNIDAASRLRMAHAPAPGTDAARTYGAAESKVERTLTIHLASWLVAPALRPPQALAAARPGEAAAVDARMAAADVIGDWVFATRRAWVRAIAARQALRHANEAVRLSAASEDLARSMRQVGSAATLDLLRAQQLHAQATARKAQRDADARLLREALQYRTGIWGISIENMQLADRLPELPPSSVNAEGLEAIAVSQRVDMQAARAAFARHEAGTSASAGAGANAARPALHDAHQAMLDATALRARAELRGAWIGYRSRLELARHACDVALPLAQRIAEEQGKRYNGMLTGVFELIAGTAEQIDAGARCTAAQRAFWLAEVDLQQALAGIGELPALTSDIGGTADISPIHAGDH
jgi:outer membrane protein TolC